MDVFENSQSVDPEVRAYIYSLVSAVGGQSTLDDGYALGDDALAVLNDLVRWLRLYDEKTNRFDVKRCLAAANLVKGDLLPILALWSEDEQENKLKSKLALKCLELLVPLTWPLALEEEKTTVNHLRHLPYLQLAQCGYKRAVLAAEEASILRTVVRIGLPHLAIPRRERTRRDDSVIRMILYFFRNIALISQPQHLPSQGDENDISRSATIDAFHAEDVFNLLLTLGSGASDEFQERDVEILEILFHLLKGVDPQKLFQTQVQLEQDETNELQGLMQKEKAMLNQYNKHAPTRHNRFGTMIWVKRGEERVSTMSGQNSITNADTTLMQMDASKKVSKPRQRGKRTAEELDEINEFGAKVELKESARRHLKSFVEDFLDSSFNPLFGSLRKAIEREAERIGSNHPRQFFYLISWFLSAESARRAQKQQQQQQQLQPAHATQEENTFAHIAAVLDQETFVLLTRQMQRCYDDNSWSDLQAILLTFTQILQTVQTMAESSDEEDQEIAENIQNRIFYEEATHDLLVSVLRTYKTQSFSYLDTVTECVHVFVRMLERYSKQNADLQIRSKRRAHRKQKDNTRTTGQTLNDNDEDIAAGDAEDEIEVHAAVRERRFDFARFSAKFLSQGCVDTFICLLRFYHDLSAEQVKRCHRYLYRLVFKHELGIFLFRVDILQLLYRIVKGPDGLSEGSAMLKDMETLVQQIFRRCIKLVERENEGEGWREAAVVEMLFSKIPGTVFYLQNGFERIIERRPPRPPAELEIKRTVEAGKRIGVAVTTMVEQGKQDAVEWVKKQLISAAEERQAWADGQAALAEVSGATAEGEYTGEGAAAAPTIFLSPDSPERKEAMFKDKFLRLLLTTLGFHRLGIAEDVEASWIVPSELGAQQLREAVDAIEAAEYDPPTFEDGQRAMDCVRNKSLGRRGATFSDDDSEPERDLEESAFQPNLRQARKDKGAERPKKRRLTRRNQPELTEGQLQERAQERRKREHERNAKIKSELLVEESDDEEADVEFFRLEGERRQKMAGFIRQELLKEAKEGKGKKGKREGGGSVNGDVNEEVGGSKKKRKISAASEEDEGGESDGSAVTHDSASSLGPMRRQVFGEFSDTEDESDVDELDERSPRANRPSETIELGEDTPSTSPPVGDGWPLGEVSANAGKRTAMFEGDSDADDEPVVKSTMQRRRPAFIVEDDSDE